MYKVKNIDQKIIVFCFIFCFVFFSLCIAQDINIEFNIDLNAATVPLPKIFKPSVDLSGRGFHQDQSWPQELAAVQVIDNWGKEVGFNGIYRLQYNLWGISQLAKDKPAQDKLLANYDAVIKKISDAGGRVILNIFGTPPGLGKVLDKRSIPWDLRAFKELVKRHVRDLSCNKKYNIWYEVWSAPDLDDFFIGRKQEYFELYEAVALGIKELEEETKIKIPVGGPSVSWWFQNFEGNTIVTPEKSLIYELMKFCYRHKLPLDFISWHAYSTDPNTEKEITSYNKAPIVLIREWLTYFNFSKDLPLVVSEWNYDRGSNVLPERKETSFICSSYIPSRIKNMQTSGLDYQSFFSLEDFQGNKEGVLRNVGVFWYEHTDQEYKGGYKSIYNVFKMLNKLGENLLPYSKNNDEFVDLISTKGQDHVALLIYNYIDPDIFTNYLTRNIASLNKEERLVMLDLLKQDTLEKITRKEFDVSRLHVQSKYNKVRTILKRAQELNDSATKFMFCSRNCKLNIKGLKENYIYQRYIIDSSCSSNCEFVPVEEKEINVSDLHQEVLTLNPYSVNLIILKKKPKEIPVVSVEAKAEPQTTTIVVEPQNEKPKDSGTEKNVPVLPAPVESATPKSAPEPEQQKTHEAETVKIDKPENSLKPKE